MTEQYKCVVYGCTQTPKVVEDDGLTVRVHCDLHNLDTYRDKNERKVQAPQMIKVNFSTDKYFKK